MIEVLTFIEELKKIRQLSHSSESFEMFAYLRKTQNKYEKIVADHEYDHMLEELKTSNKTSDEIILQHLSPSNEASIAKGIPMSELTTIQKENRGKYHYRWRGGSDYSLGYRRPQASTIKRFATSFAIYPRSAV